MMRIFSSKTLVVTLIVFQTMKRNILVSQKAFMIVRKKLKYKIRLIDSFKFMSSSLDKIVRNLEKNQFKHTRLKFGDN